MELPMVVSLDASAMHPALKVTTQSDPYFGSQELIIGHILIQSLRSFTQALFKKFQPPLL
jgi:hypothetical protein